MSNEKSSSSISLLGLLGVAFVVLKLCKVINWSWWWVTLPFWGGLALVIVGLLLYAIAADIKEMAKENSRKNDRIKYPLESQWEKRLREMRERNMEIRKQREKSN